MYMYRTYIKINHMKGSRCFLDQETLFPLLSSGWFQERILAWIHNRTRIHWGPYERL